MTRYLIATALTVIAVIGMAQPELHSARAQQPTQLPGALPIIDAAAFPSLQAALDAVPEQGGMVRLPPGVFEISQPLVIGRDDICIEGAGGATHIKNVNADGQPAMVIAHPQHDGKPPARKHELWRIRLANVRITGNEKSGAGIVARNVNELFIDGVTVSNHGGDGILLDFCYEDARVCQSVITYNKKTGLNLLGCHDIVVNGNQFEENQDALHCIDGYNLCMTGNCLDDHLGQGVVIENTYGSLVASNMFEECNGTAIVLDRDCYGITLSANVIAHNGAGIDLRDAHGCAVSANTFTIMKTAALRIGPHSGRIPVAGNSFSSSYIGDGKDKRTPDDQATGGLVLEGATGVLVDGNVFSGIDGKAIARGDDRNSRTVISTNLLIDSDPGVPAAKFDSSTKPTNYTD